METRIEREIEAAISEKSQQKLNRLLIDVIRGAGQKDQYGWLYARFLLDTLIENGADVNYNDGLPLRIAVTEVEFAGFTEVLIFDHHANVLANDSEILRLALNAKASDEKLLALLKAGAKPFGCKRELFTRYNLNAHVLTAAYKLLPYIRRVIPEIDEATPLLEPMPDPLEAEMKARFDAQMKLSPDERKKQDEKRRREAKERQKAEDEKFLNELKSQPKKQDDDWE